MTDGPVVPLLSRRIRAGGALAVAVVLTAGSLVPGGESVPASGPLAVGADKWLHAVGYAALTVAVAYALVRVDDGRKRRPALATAGVALAAAVTFGGAVELAQTAVPGRGFDSADLLANAVGAATAAGLWAAVARHVQFRPPTP